MAALDEAPRPLGQVSVRLATKLVGLDAVLDARADDELVVLVAGRRVDQPRRDQWQRLGRVRPALRRPRRHAVQQEVLPRQRRERRDPGVARPLLLLSTVGGDDVVLVGRRRGELDGGLPAQPAHRLDLLAAERLLDRLVVVDFDEGAADEHVLGGVDGVEPGGRVRRRVGAQDAATEPVRGVDLERSVFYDAKNTHHG